MEGKEFARIEELFHTALELDTAARAHYLAHECAGEEKLRAEVESLVTVFEKRNGFLEKSVFNEGLEALAASASQSLIGKLIGAYQVKKLLGKGGMGEVYLAHDTKLDRQVALKFLAPHLAADAWAKRQLIKEAQATAMLDHPNICAVYRLEEADGHSFIVMQYLEGESLADLMNEGRLDRKRILPLALQMARALVEAHAHGIIHRDIKPRNLILTLEGQLKVLDFGVAKVIQGKQNKLGGPDAPSQDSRGMILGTVAYMSPEQLRGERLDYRSDVFSMGAVLYELAAGEHPFAKENDAVTSAAILSNEPPQGVNDLPHDLEPIVRKCLEKDKERRYQSASEVLLDLEALQMGKSPRWPRRRIHSLVLAGILATLMGGWFFAKFRQTAAPTVAILPFVNESAGPQNNYLIAGLSDGVAHQLAYLSSVRIKAPVKIAKPPTQLADSLSVARELSADVVLIGKATERENKALLELRLIKTSDGGQLWTTVYDLTQMDALVLPELIAAKTANALRLSLSKQEEKLLFTHQTTKTEAFHEYLRGRYDWNWRDRKRIQSAIDHFRMAIKIDPAFARAFTGLADSYVLLNSVAYGEEPTDAVMAKAKWAVRQALEIDDNSAEAHTSQGVIKLRYDWKWQEAEAEFRRAIALKQDYAPAHYWFSVLLMITGRKSQSIEESEIARDIDPISPSINLNRCRTSFLLRDYNNAVQCLNEMLEREPQDANAQYILGLAYQELGKSAQAIEIFKKLYASEKQKFYGATPLAYVYGKTGKRDEAVKILAEMEERSRSSYLPPIEMAIVHLGLGDKDNAFLWLEKAFEQRFASLMTLTVEPLFDGLRSDPRYFDLARRMELQP